MLSFSEEYAPNTVLVDTADDGDFHFFSPRGVNGNRIFEIS